MFLKQYQSCTSTLNISNGMDISLLPPCRSATDMYIRTVNYQACLDTLPWKRARPFRFGQKWEENKCGGN